MKVLTSVLLTIALVLNTGNVFAQYEIGGSDYYYQRWQIDTFSVAKVPPPFLRDSVEVSRKIKIILTDGVALGCEAVGIVDACSHFGFPYGHEIAIGSRFGAPWDNVKKIVFIRRVPRQMREAALFFGDGNRFFRIERANGTADTVTIMFYYESQDGAELPGTEPSNYYNSIPCKFTEASDQWEDHVEFTRKGWRFYWWKPWSSVREIVFYEETKPLNKK